MEYLTNCVNSTEILISKMVIKSKEIKYKTLLKYITKKQIDELFPFYKEVPNLTIENDYTTSFYKSEYDGKKCVFIEHSRIEYVFTN
jgi:hypothetical protein